MTPRGARAALAVDTRRVARRGAQIEAWFDKIGDTLPTQLQVELDGLKARLGIA